MSLAASLAASAQTIDFGSFVLDFDNSTALGAPTADMSGANGLVTSSWAIPGSVQLAVNGDVDFVEFALPSFTLSAKQPAFRLHGPVGGLLGELAFSEFGETQTFATIDGELAIDGHGPIAVGGDMTRTVTSSESGNFALGYYSAAATAALGEFSSLAFSNGHLNLIVFGTGAVFAQPHSELRLSFFAAPVPVPTALWLFGSALGGLGFVRRRSV